MEVNVVVQVNQETPPVVPVCVPVIVQEVPVDCGEQDNASCCSGASKKSSKSSKSSSSSSSSSDDEEEKAIM